MACKRLFSVEFLRCSEGAADIDGDQLHRRARITENQSDEIVDDEDETQRDTEIEQRGDDEERHLHPSHGRGKSAGGGRQERDGKDFDMAVIHGNFPSPAINSHSLLLFPIIGASAQFS